MELSKRNTIRTCVTAVTDGFQSSATSVIQEEYLRL